MKLDIGAGHNPKEGYKSVDIIPEADYSVDLENDRIPLQDESVDEIFTQHTFEHLNDLIHIMNESWRVLKWGGKMEIIVPHMDCVLAYQDPTHKRFFNTESIKYFLGYYINKYKLNYGIQCAFKLIENKKEVIKEKTDTENLEDKTYFIQIRWILEKNKEYYKENKPFCLNENKEESSLESINSSMEEEIKKSFELFKKKNADYNNDYFTEEYSKEFLFNNFIRKYKRLEQFYLKNKDFEVNDETVEDTLRDLAIYSLMEIVRIKNQKKK